LASGRRRVGQVNFSLAGGVALGYKKKQNLVIWSFSHLIIDRTANALINDQMTR
jgi:hypothetical protein